MKSHIQRNWTPAFLALGLLAALSAAGAQDEVSVHAGNHPDYRAYLTDASGMTLYLFSEDEGGEIRCLDECAEAWPPLQAQGDVTAGPGVAASLLGTIERPDGAMQVTYNGIPLYYFARDEAPGDVSGQGVGDSWYLVSPFGTAIEPIAEAAGEGEAEESVELSEEAVAHLMEVGEAAYNTNCSACHGAQGQGVSGPALAGRNLSNDSRVIRQILNGSGHMPAFGSVLDDEQVAGVVTYIRNSWGNSGSPVSAEEVMQYR